MNDTTPTAAELPGALAADRLKPRVDAQRIFRGPRVRPTDGLGEFVPTRGQSRGAANVPRPGTV